MECTESTVAPTLDSVGAAFFVFRGLSGLALVAAACGDKRCSEDTKRVELVSSVASLGVATAYVFSARRGTANVKRCLELRCASGVESACRKLPQPPPEPLPVPENPTGPPRAGEPPQPQ